MAAANTGKSAQHALETLVLGTASSGSATAGGPSVTKYVLTGVTIPTAAANVTTVVNATVNGAVVGDICLISGPTVALAHQTAPRAQVIAADTVEISASGDGTGFTGASKTYNLLLFKQS